MSVEIGWGSHNGGYFWLKDGEGNYNIMFRDTQHNTGTQGFNVTNFTTYMRTLLFILLATTAYAQKQTEYKASNGITYHVGDTIKLGYGSGPSHDFLYVVTPSNISLGRGYSGASVVIKKIQRVNFRGLDKVYFETNIGKYLLYIEDAIAFCEIKDCK